MLFLFLSLALTCFLVLFLSIVKLIISDFNWNVISREESSSYECGFEQHSLSRVPLSIRYFMLTLVFLIFDLEIILLLFSPVDLFLGLNKSLLVLISLFFITILFLGLLFEWLDGSLDWIIWWCSSRVECWFEAPKVQLSSSMFLVLIFLLTLLVFSCFVYVRFASFKRSIPLSVRNTETLFTLNPFYTIKW